MSDFLKLVRTSLCVHACPPMRLLITSGVLQHDKNSISYITVGVGHLLLHQSEASVNNTRYPMTIVI